MRSTEYESEKSISNTTNTLNISQSEKKVFTDSENALLSTQEFNNYSQIIRDSYEPSE